VVDPNTTEQFQDNPFAICNAMAKEFNWSKEKTERCILDLKKKSGSKEFQEACGSFMDTLNSNLGFTEDERKCFACGELHPEE